MLIRKEKPEDYEIIYSVVKDAFDSAEHSDGNEQDLVNALRKGEAFIPGSLTLPFKPHNTQILYLSLLLAYFFVKFAKIVRASLY